MSIISFIIPCFNEEANIIPFYNAIKELFSQNNLYSDDQNFELIFIDDGSCDGTLIKIRALHEQDKRVKCVSFSRNFGKEAALFAGIEAFSGDCAIFIDADLQHPVSVIPEMISKWKEGFEVVEGVKSDRGGGSFIHKIFTKIFYGMISRSVGIDMKNSSDYKLLDKKVMLELAKLEEKNTFFRALSFWVGFKKTTIYYKVNERNAGESKWSTKSLVKYAINNIVCFSYAPLYIPVFIGIVFVILGVFFGIMLIKNIIDGTTQTDFLVLLLFLAFGFGGIMIALGIIGVYIAQVYDEIKKRPRFIIREKIE